jgi:agmatinase
MEQDVTEMRGAADRLNRGFVGVPTFLRANYCADMAALAAEFAVIGVPFDEGSPFAPGARFAPRVIREHSLRFGTGGLYDIDSDSVLAPDLVTSGRLVDCGDVDIWPTNPARTFQNLTQAVRMVLARGGKPVIIGGDHSITFPILQGYDRPVHVVQLDAHMDYGAVTEDLRHTNGQAFRQLHALPHVESLTQIGIRSFRTRASDVRDARANGSTIVTMPKLREVGATGALAHIPDGASVYVSIDVDAYDMALVPGCVSAEPDGMRFDELTGILDMVARRFAVVGFDFVEVNPPLDVGTGVTSYLGALTIAKFLSAITTGDRP